MRRGDVVTRCVCAPKSYHKEARDSQMFERSIPSYPLQIEQQWSLSVVIDHFDLFVRSWGVEEALCR